MPDTAHSIALEEVALQRDYLLGLLVEKEVPDRRSKGARTRLRAKLSAESRGRGTEADRIREVGKS